MAGLLDRWLPAPDIREQFGIPVQAPADLVYEITAGFDVQSLPVVRAIFWLRTAMMGGTAASRWPSDGFLTDVRRMGWGVLAEEPGRVFVAGASCQPWQADVVFEPRSAGDFLAFSAPDRVKIAWSIEVTPTGPAQCRLTTETRAVATDDASRRRFLRYWRWARFGILPIRWLLLPAIRRRAQSQHRAG